MTKKKHIHDESFTLTRKTRVQNCDYVAHDKSSRLAYRSLVNLAFSGRQRCFARHGLVTRLADSMLDDLCFLRIWMYMDVDGDICISLSVIQSIQYMFCLT